LPDREGYTYKGTWEAYRGVWYTYQGTQGGIYRGITHPRDPSGRHI